MEPTPNYQILLCYLADADPSVSSRIEAWAEELRAKRQWPIGTGPRFVNEVSDPGNPEKGDLPIVTIGVSLQILPPQKGRFRDALEKMTYDDVAFLANEACRYSAREKVQFELEIDGVYVGAIANGAMNRSLQNGLLGEWARVLADVTPR